MRPSSVIVVCDLRSITHGCMGPAPAPLPTAEMAQESTFGGGIGGVHGDVKVVRGATQRSGE